MDKNPYLPGTKEEFLEKNLALVCHICKKYNKLLVNTNGVCSMEDLMSYGKIGLIKAYNAFNPSKFEGGIKFSTYAFRTIEGEILRFFRDFNVGAKINRQEKLDYMQIHKSGLQEEKTSVISSKTGLPIERVEKALESHIKSRPLSIDAMIYDDPNSLSILDYIPSGDKPLQDVAILNDFFNHIPDQYVEIANMYFKLDYTQQDIAKLLNTTQVSISRKIKKILQMAEDYCKKGEN